MKFVPGEGKRQRANAMDDTKRREKSDDEGSEQDDQGPMQDKRKPADPFNAMSSPEHSVCNAIIADEDGAEKSDASDWTNVSFDSRFVPIQTKYLAAKYFAAACLLALAYAYACYKFHVPSLSHVVLVVSCR